MPSSEWPETSISRKTVQAFESAGGSVAVSVAADMIDMALQFDECDVHFPYLVFGVYVGVCLRGVKSLVKLMLLVDTCQKPDFHSWWKPQRVLMPSEVMTTGENMVNKCLVVGELHMRTPSNIEDTSNHCIENTGNKTETAAKHLTLNFNMHQAHCCTSGHGESHASIWAKLSFCTD